MSTIIMSMSTYSIKDFLYVDYYYLYVDIVIKDCFYVDY